MIKKILKITLFSILGILLLVVLAFGFWVIKSKIQSSNNMDLAGSPAVTLNIDGHFFRDLNKNGKLDTYEDTRADIDERIDDLVKQMNIEEKAGLMFINIAIMNKDGSLSEVPSIDNIFSFLMSSNSEQILRKKMNHFNIIQSDSAIALLRWHNNVQALAEKTRLGIPITIASDPRHVVGKNPGANVPTPFFSLWCSSLGFGAINDAELVRTFGDIARQEYRAVGIHLALSPMADLATEPRWARVNGTFGEDAGISAKLTKAYILGFQGDNIDQNSVACMVKHFPGAGPQKDGEDAHFPYGKDQVYPKDNFDYHLIPFSSGAFPAKVAQVMPYYGVPNYKDYEKVGFAYNKEIITDLLRNKFKFNGVICTDWGLVSDNFFKPPANYGVEGLSNLERVERLLLAGNDMLGGESLPELVVELVKNQKISMERIDESVKRILKDKFRLGLFDNPYLDEKNLSIVGSKAFVEKGLEAQRRSLVLLKNQQDILPLKKGKKVFVQGMDKKVFSPYSQVVASPEQADIIILKLGTPFEPRDEYFLEQFFHQGRLYFTEKEKKSFMQLINTKPTITIVTMDRPPILSDITSASKSLIADFHSQDNIIAEMIFGQFSPSGKLPFELPSSKKAVEMQAEDTPYDSASPLFPFGFGLTY